MDFDNLYILLNNRRSKGETYDSIAADYTGVTRAHIWKIINKRSEPTEPHLRQAFGLPAMKPAPVCKCGEVHTTKRCTANDKPRRKKDLYAYSVKELRWMLENRR